VRRRVARFLAENGPIWGDDAALALGLTLWDWWCAVDKCRWFTFDLPGKAGWQLTECGRKEAL
jgi:hypothetical protein